MADGRSGDLLKTAIAQAVQSCVAGDDEVFQSLLGDVENETITITPMGTLTTVIKAENPHRLRPRKFIVTVRETR